MSSTADNSGKKYLKRYRDREDSAATWIDYDLVWIEDC